MYFLYFHTNPVPVGYSRPPDSKDVVRHGFRVLVKEIFLQFNYGKKCYFYCFWISDRCKIWQQFAFGLPNYLAKLSVVASFAYSAYWKRLLNSVAKLDIKVPKNTALLKKSSAFTGR